MMLSCPRCGSQRFYKDGLRYLTDGSRRQRFLCRECSYRFSESENSKGLSGNRCNRQVCVTWPGAKNLESATKTKIVAEDRRQASDIKGKIVEYAWHLKKDGYAEATIRRYVQSCKTLTDYGADLFDPESVKEVIAKQNWLDGTKLNYVSFYDSFAKFIGIKWEKPRYRNTAKLPFIPTEREIDLLIHGARGKKLSTILQIIKETGMRIGEVTKLKWKEIDNERNIITLNTPEKHGKSRMFKVSSQLIQRILTLKHKNSYIFGKSSTSYGTCLSVVRGRLAKEYSQPRLLQIHFHTLRHWKATMEYHRTKDILHVKEMLGHQSVDNTLIYIHLEKTLYNDPNNQGFHVRVAHDTEEACELAKSGFEFVTGEYEDGGKIFRKPA